MGDAKGWCKRALRPLGGIPGLETEVITVAYPPFILALSQSNYTPQWRIDHRGGGGVSLQQEVSPWSDNIQTQWAATDTFLVIFALKLEIGVCLSEQQIQSTRKLIQLIFLIYSTAFKD